MAKKLASELKVGDWLNMNVADPNYPAPGDCELNLVRIEKVVVTGDRVVIFTTVEESPVPGDPSGPMDYPLETFDAGATVRVWTDAEAAAIYGGAKDAPTPAKYELGQRVKITSLLAVERGHEGVIRSRTEHVLADDSIGWFYGVLIDEFRGPDGVLVYGHTADVGENMIEAATPAVDPSLTIQFLTEDGTWTEPTPLERMDDELIEALRDALARIGGKVIPDDPRTGFASFVVVEDGETVAGG